jgi:hypothetical protein
VAEEVYHIVASTDVVFDRDLFTITLHDFRYISGCAAVQRDASPACCRMNPCPVCSLFMCMVASSLNLPCTIEQADMSPKGDDLNVAIRVVRGAGESPVYQGTEIKKDT